MFVKLSSESEELLKEILEKENETSYCINKANELDTREKVIFLGCLKELESCEMIQVDYADNGPYSISVLKEGYLYEKHMEEEKKNNMNLFEKRLYDLLERTKTINAPINISNGDIDIDDYNAPAEEWMNDVQIFHDKFLKTHSLSNRIKHLLFSRTPGAYKEIISCLKSIQKDEDFIMALDADMVSISRYKAKGIPEFDVFLSHANQDKEEIVESLYISLKKLGVNIFYDKESLDWGDNWKSKIIEGTNKSEFAIIVISENFFGREWTEKELQEFLNRQNRVGQKIILPILHNTTIDQLYKKYPLVADLQAISTESHSCDEIALLFAKEFIKRLKGE